MINKQWNPYIKPDTVCQDCFYCINYDLSGGTQYLCNCADCTPSACLNLDHKYFLNRSEHMTMIPEKCVLSENTCKQIANILKLLTDYCHDTSCTYCPFSVGDKLVCRFRNVAELNPAEFFKITKLLRGD